MNQSLLSDPSSKLEITKSLIDSIQEAHEKGHFGFDLRPSAILCTKGNMGLSAALIGFVGDGNLIAKHPDYTKLRWDRDWTAPELAARSRPRREAAQSSQEQGTKTANGPTAASDVFSLGKLLLILLEKLPNVQEFVAIVLEDLPQKRCDIHKEEKERIRLQEEAKEKERIRLQEEAKEKERIRLQEEAKEKERIR
ncbi:MAG: hypothetical protein EZS28_042138, partial [Streblomastix strix]